MQGHGRRPGGAHQVVQGRYTATWGIQRNGRLRRRRGSEQARLHTHGRWGRHLGGAAGAPRASVGARTVVPDLAPCSTRLCLCAEINAGGVEFVPRAAEHVQQQQQQQTPVAGGGAGAAGHSSCVTSGGEPSGPGRQPMAGSSPGRHRDRGQAAAAASSTGIRPLTAAAAAAGAADGGGISPALELLVSEVRLARRWVAGGGGGVCALHCWGRAAHTWQPRTCACACTCRCIVARACQGELHADLMLDAHALGWGLRPSPAHPVQSHNAVHACMRTRVHACARVHGALPAWGAGTLRAWWRLGTGRHPPAWRRCPHEGCPSPGAHPFPSGSPGPAALHGLALQATAKSGNWQQ